VRLELGDATYLPKVIAPLDVVTVLGNLVDNGVAAAAAVQAKQPWVEVSLVAEAGDLQIVVVDSGSGVPPDIRDRLFEPGVTSKTDRRQPHGVGLTLARQITRRHGGDLELADPGGPECGAIFVARLRDVVETPSEDFDFYVEPAHQAGEGAT
jgi:two-component system CitB family sensor kinase